MRAIAPIDLDAGFVRVERTVLLIGADVTEGSPKSRAGERLTWLDAETVRLLREHHTAQRKARMQVQPGTRRFRRQTLGHPDQAMTSHLHPHRGAGPPGRR